MEVAGQSFLSSFFFFPPFHVQKRNAKERDTKEDLPPLPLPLPFPREVMMRRRRELGGWPASISTLPLSTSYRQGREYRTREPSPPPPLPPLFPPPLRKKRIRGVGGRRLIVFPLSPPQPDDREECWDSFFPGSCVPFPSFPFSPPFLFRSHRVSQPDGNRDERGFSSFPFSSPPSLACGRRHDALQQDLRLFFLVRKRLRLDRLSTGPDIPVSFPFSPSPLPFPRMDTNSS